MNEWYDSKASCAFQFALFAAVSDTEVWLCVSYDTVSQQITNIRSLQPMHQDHAVRGNKEVQRRKLRVQKLKQKQNSMMQLLYVLSRIIQYWWDFCDTDKTSVMPSVLWCCWLGSRKGIQPVKNWVVGCWHGYVSGSRYRFAYGPADATATHYLLLR